LEQKFMMITSVADLADGEVAAIATTTPTVFVPGVVVSVPKNLEQNLPRRSAAAGGDLSSLDDSAAVENVLSCWTEVCEQCWLSGPTILMLLLQYFTALTVVTFVGRLGASYLAAMSMATSFVGIVGFDVLVRTWFPNEDRQREERNCRKKFKRFFLNLCVSFSFADRTVKRTRDFVWTSVWSKAVPSAGNLLATSHIRPPCGGNTHLLGMLLHGTHLDCLR
jgi:hypothetical protein